MSALDSIGERLRGTFSDLMGMELVEGDAEGVTARLPESKAKALKKP